MAQEGRRVRFVVHCRDTRFGEHLRVVGVPKALGGWEPQDSTVRLATSPSEFPLWRSCWVQLPKAHCNLEYKYVICSDSGASRWEGRQNRLLDLATVLASACVAENGSCGGVTVGEVFNSCEPPQLLPESTGSLPTQSPNVSTTASTASTPTGGARMLVEVEANDYEGELVIRFVVTCSKTRPGQDVRVVGSIGALGSWLPDASSVVLQTRAGEFPTWRSDWVPIPCGEQHFEYKYVICGRGATRWERGSNRVLRVSEAGRGTPKAQAGKLCVTAMDEFDVPSGRIVEEWEPRSEKKPRQPSPLPPLPKEVVESLPIRKTIPRNPASFCTLSQALEPTGLHGTQVTRRPSKSRVDTEVPNMRRARTIGCLIDLPEGLVPTKRSLGLQCTGGDEDFVREAVYTELAGGQDAEMPHALSSVSTGSPSESTTASPSDTSDPSAGARRQQGDPEEESSGGEESVPPSAASAVGQSAVEAGFTGLRKRDGYHFDEAPMKCFEDCYMVYERLGEGAFGVVYHCGDRVSGKECAVKVVNKDHLQPYALAALLGDEAAGREGEISIHRSLPPHGNIVGIHDCFHEPRTVRLVMDMCCGGDLFDAIYRAKQLSKSVGRDAALPEKAAASVAWQVLSGLAFCHAHGVVHRDVKAENVLLAYPEDKVPLDGESAAVVKLCDFGLSARCWATDGPVLMDPVGSPDYVAPEVARREAYGQAVDVWSAGVLLFASLRGRLPFPARTDQEALMMVKAGRCVYDEGWMHQSPEAKQCTEHQLCVCPTERPTAEEAQRHPFFQRAMPLPPG